MDKLLHHYEQELGRLRQATRQYAEAHPITAEALELGPDASTDPEVERLLQSVALLNASMQQCIEENKREFHRALLQTLQPHYLQFVPACGIVQIDTTAARENEISTVTKLPHGSILRAGECKFTTAYDACIAPITIASVKFDPTIDLPATLQLPNESISALKMMLEIAASGPSFAKPPLDKLRIYINGEPELRAALYDATLMRCLCVCLETDGKWQVLPKSPFTPTGFTSDEALLPPRPGPQSPRLLTEFFQLPEKFGFVDIDLASIASFCPQTCKRITLHVVLPNCPSMLRQASARNFQQACTPVINLFQDVSNPVRMDGRTEAYPIAPKQAGCEVYSIDNVSRLSSRGDKAFPPFHGTEHTAPGPYWHQEKEEGIAVKFIDRQQQTVIVDSGTIVAQLTCTNVHLPQQSAILTTDASAGGFPIRLLHGLVRRTQIADPARLSAALYGEEASLSSMRELLELHGCKFSTALKNLITKPSTAWLQHPMGRLHMHGTEFTLIVDEQAMRSHSIYGLAEVLSIALADLLRENRYAQLRIANESGQMLYQTSPRIGTRRLA